MNLSPADQTVLQQALALGYVTQPQVQHLLAIRQQYLQQGQAVEVFQLLATAIPPARVQDLRQRLTQSTVSGAPTVAGAIVPVESNPNRIAHYEIERELARGGMGVVYAARDTKLERRVAIKKMLPGKGTSQKEVERFLREAQVVGQMRHPNIVRVHDVGQQDGSYYMVMDLIEGRSLMQRLKQEGPFEEEEAARIALQLSWALRYSHERGILHRDVKPQNVLLTRNGEPQLTDFGLVKLVGEPEAPVAKTGSHTGRSAITVGLEPGQRSLTIEGQVLGTPGYMPPEQADGAKGSIDARSDVYALGATLYAILTGRAPFMGNNLVNLLTAVLTRAPEAPSSLRSGLDPELERICMKCLEKEPGDRYPDAASLGEDLEAFLQKFDGSTGGRATSKRRTGGRTTGSRRGGRNARSTSQRALRGRRGDDEEDDEAPARSGVHPAVFLVGLVPLIGLLLFVFSGGDPEPTEQAEEPAKKTEQPAPPPSDDPPSPLDGNGPRGPAGSKRGPSVGDLVEIAEVQLEQGKSDEALATYEKILAQEGRNVAALVGRGTIRLARDDRTGAKQDLDLALKLDPKHGGAWYQRGLLREATGDEPGAVAAWTKAVEHDEELASAWGKRGLARAAQGESGAAEDLKTLLDLDPKHPLASKARVALAKLRGSEKTEDPTPSDPGPKPGKRKLKVVLNEAAQAIFSKRPNQALQILASLTPKQAKKARAIWMRSRALILLDRSQEALKNTTAFLARRPGNKIMLIDRAIMYMGLEQYAPALEDLEAAQAAFRKKGEEVPALTFLHAEAALALDKKRMAIRDFSRLIDRHPSGLVSIELPTLTLEMRTVSVNLYLNRGDLFDASKQRRKAKKDWKRALEIMEPDHPRRVEIAKRLGKKVKPPPARPKGPARPHGEVYGSPEGKAFQEQPPSADITEIRTQSGSVVDALQLVWGGTVGPQHGRGGGGPTTMKLQPGEFITGISGYYGSWVFQITFHTNQRTIGPVGQKNGMPFRLDAPPGHEVCGLRGYEGKWLSAVGILVRKR